MEGFRRQSGLAGMKACHTGRKNLGQENWLSCQPLHREQDLQRLALSCIPREGCYFCFHVGFLLHSVLYYLNSHPHKIMRKFLLRGTWSIKLSGMPKMTEIVIVGRVGTKQIAFCDISTGIAG